MDFEKANQELEEIIKKLEDENTTLSQGIELYEKANMLIKVCEEQMKNAKEKIEIIKGEENENI